jgi:WD40 repeat protein
VRAVAGWRETARIAVERSHDFALAPDGVRVAVTRSERDDARSPWRRRIDVLDAASGQRVTTLPDDRPLQLLRFSTDGRHLLAVGESADEVRVWRLADAALAARLRHDAEIDRMRIAPSGDVVATASGRQISIWHIPTGELLGQFRADDRFTDFAFTAGGERLLTGDTSGTLSLWRWRTEDLREEGCRRLTRNLQRDEWTRYVGDAPYRATCPHLPMSAEPAASSAASVAAASQRPR